MDKGWMQAPRSTSQYAEGVLRFLEFAFTNSAKQNKIMCPCKNCSNTYWLGLVEVHEHLICHGFMAGYMMWSQHGEQRLQPAEPVAESNAHIEDLANSDEIEQMLMEGFGMYNTASLGAEEDLEDDFGYDDEEYRKLVADGGQDLYPGCKTYSKLQFIVRLLNIKNLSAVSDGSFELILWLFKDVLPEGQSLPKNLHDAKRFVRAIGAGYENVHACINDCILYRKENSNKESCPVCDASRWKTIKTGVDGRRVHKVPQKVARHFPLKKRINRMFLCSKTSEHMRWHSDGRTKDGFMRHPADSPAWKHFDATHEWFSKEARNVRFGLATYGFNPFRNMNISYSIWPIMLIPYNLPPWICMTQSNFILSVLVPGKKSPGKDMDVYMQLTIDDLQECWKPGFMTYDSSCSRKFRVHAALLWTISDWLGRGLLSGESIAVCSHCLTDTCSRRLKHGHKTCYMGQCVYDNFKTSANKSKERAWVSNVIHKTRG